MAFLYCAQKFAQYITTNDDSRASARERRDTREVGEWRVIAGGHVRGAVIRLGNLESRKQVDLRLLHVERGMGT